MRLLEKSRAARALLPDDVLRVKRIILHPSLNRRLLVLLEDLLCWHLSLERLECLLSGSEQ